MKSTNKSAAGIETMLKPMERGQITLPKSMRDAVGITPDTWLWVRLTNNGKIEVEPVKSTKKPSLSAALLKIAKSKKPIWTDEDTSHLKKLREKSTERLSKLQW